ncbi:hypothetical protein HanIR_Chr15g0768411 [Helianthus annuus]|nr:hypothetical protein HanIR_Chr15g0768411 [Helianthus annuus]
MVKSRRGKEKETASPEDVAVGSKRAKRGTRVEIRETPLGDFVQAPRGHGDVPYRPTLRDGPLYKQEAAYQAELFYEKMGDTHSIRSNACFEKRIHKPDLRALGLYEKFIELDWEPVLDFQGNESGEVYLRSVMEWLSTLTKNDRSDPPRTVTLTEKVNGKPATMSPASLSQIAKFDSKADSFYTFIKEDDYYNDQKKIVGENVMYSELFLLDKGVGMKRDNLKPLVRVLLSLVVSNVAPRLGDMMGIRKWELVVLFALMTGQMHLSFRQLVMLHIWQSQNKRQKKLIPHARLISAFLRKQGVVPISEKPFEKLHATFSIVELCTGDRITHVKTKLWHKIKFGDGAKLKLLQWGKQPPSQGEMDDLDSSDEKVLQRRREAGVQVGEGGSRQYDGPRQSDYSWECSTMTCRRGCKVASRQNMMAGRCGNNLCMIKARGWRSAKRGNMRI